MKHMKICLRINQQVYNRKIKVSPSLYLITVLDICKSMTVSVFITLAICGCKASVCVCCTSLYILIKASTFHLLRINVCSLCRIALLLHHCSSNLGCWKSGDVVGWAVDLCNNRADDVKTVKRTSPFSQPRVVQSTVLKAECTNWAHTFHFTPCYS